MPITLRKFNGEGMDEFKEILQAQRIGMFDEIDSLIVDDRYSKSLEVEMDLKPFNSRFLLGRYLWDFFQKNRIGGLDSIGDPEFWTWLAAAWMRILVEADPRKELSRKIGSFERWILTESVRRYHWHVISNPFFIYSNNSESPHKAIALLATDVLKPGDLVDKISSNRRFSKPPISHLVTLLYYDRSKAKLRAGHTSRLGEVNQLSKYLNQIDRTVDYEGLKVSEIIDLLPANFGEWANHARRELKTLQKNESRK